MVDTPKELIKPQYMVQGAALYYTVPAGTTTMIKDLRVVNNSDQDAEVLFRLGSYVAGRTIVPLITVKAGRIGIFDEPIILEVGDYGYLYGYCQYESVIEISAHGVQFT